MKLGIVNESDGHEARVAMTPDVAVKLIKKGHSIAIESGAGVSANHSDSEYLEAGVQVLASAAEVQSWATALLRIHPPSENEAALRPDQLLITNIYPGSNKDLVERLKATNATVMALDCVPRITRAQKCDVRSSMDNIAGYRAVVEAANAYSGFFGGQMTAAGKSAPATVLIIGAGVAGLAAIGAARGLGAEVRAFDVREAAREQVQSMGAEFIQVNLEESGDGGGGYAKVMSEDYHKAQMALFLEQAAEVDIVISTANIPGRKAPILWEKRHVEAMKAGSVVVDLAAGRGGNCELTTAGETIVHNGVKIIGFTDLNSRMSQISSRFFAMNLFHLLAEIGEVAQAESGKFSLDMENDIIRPSTVLDNGELIWPPPRPEPAPAPEPQAEPDETEEVVVAAEPSGAWRPLLGLVLAVLFTVIGIYAPSDFVQQFTVFVLACFIGWQVVWNVSHSLHTPLMSVTNAISGIIIVGGMLQLGGLNPSENPVPEHTLAAILGIIAILFAAINVAGGFLVTKRMLAMFQRGES